MRARPGLFFTFALARELGMTRRQMLLSLDSVELAGWKAFFKIENEEMEAKRNPPKPSVGDKIKAGLMAMKGKHGSGKVVRNAGAIRDRQGKA